MKTVVILFLGAILTAIGCTSALDRSSNQAVATINGSAISVEIADTPEKKQQGLSNRNSLPPDAGMLFDFTKDANKQPKFWMKEMKFNIDIIWIKDNKIIFIHNDVPAPTESNPSLPHYTPPNDIDYVLEVNAGVSTDKGWQVGDIVTLELQ